ncbi:hypothetical protein RN69_26450 [Bradyrhizobium japonicum]|nr:hypothetical protein RN69_26450 [Bradyrhizobium japonicum]
MVAALIMARGYKAGGFQGQVQIDRGVTAAAPRDGRMPHLATAGCRTVTARCRTDVIGSQRNFP